MDKKKGLTRIVIGALAGVTLASLVCGCSITTLSDGTGYRGRVPIWEPGEYQPPSKEVLKDMDKNPLKYNSSSHNLPTYHPPVSRFD